MDLRDLISEMVVVGFRGTQLPEDSSFIKTLKKYTPGGVVLFDYDLESRKYGRNIESPSQLKALTETLQGFSQKPLLISVDQEGGKVSRLKERYGFTVSESAESIGHKDDLEITSRWASKMAQELKGCGVNCNFAPSVDLNLNPDNPIIGALGRSFSDSVDEVVKQASIFIEEMRKKGILTSIKHFPGHGSSKGDTHEGFVDVSDCWKADELEPFRSLIENGLVDSVMTSHIFNRHLDEKFPATLSKKIIRGVLRGELGFDGVVFSDDMQMGAIRDHYGFEYSIMNSINGGVDILCFGNNLVFDEGIVERFVLTVESLVKRGLVEEERIKESFERIDQFKQKL